MLHHSQIHGCSPCSVAQSCPALLRPCRLLHTRLLCPSLSPRVCSHLGPLSRWCHPTILLSPVIPFFMLSIFPSIRVFTSESTLYIRWPKYCSFNFSISPSNEYSGLISFRIYWLDLLAVQETLKSLLQQHSSKASILWCWAFLWSNSNIRTWLLEKQKLWLDGPLLAKWCLCFLIHYLGLL